MPEGLKSLFQKYAKKYNFDSLKVTALACQESGFDQSVRSRAGAVGIIQILPIPYRGSTEVIGFTYLLFLFSCILKTALFFPLIGS